MFRFLVTVCFLATWCGDTGVNAATSSEQNYTSVVGRASNQQPGNERLPRALPLLDPANPRKKRSGIQPVPFLDGGKTAPPTLAVNSVETRIPLGGSFSPESKLRGSVVEGNDQDQVNDRLIQGSGNTRATRKINRPLEAASDSDRGAANEGKYTSSPQTKKQSRFSGAHNGARPSERLRDRPRERDHPHGLSVSTAGIYGEGDTGRRVGDVGQRTSSVGSNGSGYVLQDLRDMPDVVSESSPGRPVNFSGSTLPRTPRNKRNARNGKTSGNLARDRKRRLTFRLSNGIPKDGDLNPIRLKAATAYLDPNFLTGSNLGPASSSNPFLNSGRISAVQGVFDGGPIGNGDSPLESRLIPQRPIRFVPPKLYYQTGVLPKPFTLSDDDLKPMSTRLTKLLKLSPQDQARSLNLNLPETLRDAGSTKISDAIGNESQDFLHRFVTPAPTNDFPDVPNDDQRDGADAEVDGAPIYRHKISSPSGLLIANIHEESGYRPISEDEVEDEHLTQSISKGAKFANPLPVWAKVKVLPSPSLVEHEETSSYHENEDDNARYAQEYAFGYRVTDHENGNDFGHEETRVGNITDGRYHVLLPDGRVQNVKYHVDGGGYRAEVSYELSHGR